MSPLSVEGAHVYRSGKLILNDVSLELPAGQVTAVIGPNGAGKSTLFSVAAGQLAPAAGRVILHGKSLRKVHSKKAAQMRSVMPQDSRVAFAYTVREVVAMGRTPWGTTPAENHRIVSTTLRLAGMSDFAEQEITTLSGGERQRAAFARVLTQAWPIRPGGVLLLDEPTAAMDIRHAEATLALLRTCASRGAAVGVVLHDLDAAANYADQLVLMDRGRVHAAGSVAEVCRTEVLSEVYRTPIEVSRHRGALRVAPLRQAA